MAANFNLFMRKIHRYLAWPFVIFMVVNIILMNFGDYTSATKLVVKGTNLTVTISMAITGIYLFCLPYSMKKARKG